MRDSFFDDVRAFYHAHRHGLLSYARTLVHDTSSAEDLVQAAIYRLLKRGRAPRNLRPYLFRSLRNAAIDRHRSRVRAEQLAVNEPNQMASESVPEATDLAKALSELSRDDREIVMLKAVAGLTFREIAGVVRRNEHTVASRYRRSLARLRRELGEES